MVIFLNLDGTAQKVVPEHIYQGSNNVTDITVIAPYAATTAMEIGFILPNGLYWQSTDGARYAPMLQVQQDINPDVSAWSFTLPLSVTEQVGDVYVAINAVTNTGNTTSYLCKITVEESVLPNLPFAPEPGVYDLIRQYLAQLDARTIRVPNLVERLDKVAPNAFTFTAANGIVSEPIVLEGGESAPMPLNVASTIDIPSSAWTLVSPPYATQKQYSVTITAAQHGQLRDGAKVNDLWVSFDRYSNNAAGEQILNGSYYGYKIADNGDIQLSFTTNNPETELVPHLTIRVWNGKVTDVTARNEIANEITRAKAAEQNLQSQINEIEQSGVDLTAREQIEAETARAKAAEGNLQDLVDLLDMDIADNRKAISKINSYIPPGTGNATSTQLTNRPWVTNFVNSSINNMAAFYITSNAQGDAFPTRESLLNATTYYYGGEVRTPTQNDYAIVLADESQPKGVDGNYPTTRYSYQGGEWAFQYVVNNTSLTQAQVDAINSGITEQKIASMDAATAAKYTKPASGIPESDLSADVQSKLNANSSAPRKNLYNLGVYDTFVSNGDGTGTITRKTGYYKFTGTEIGAINWNKHLCYFNCSDLDIPDGNPIDGGSHVVSNLLPTAPTYSDIYNAIMDLGIRFGDTNSTGKAEAIAMRIASIPQTLADYKQWLSQHDLYVQYELAAEYQYTEQVIENQPIHHLNQDGENWLDSEFRKGLNLLPESLVVHTGSYDMVQTDFYLPAGTYTCTLQGSDLEDSGVEYQILVKDAAHDNWFALGNKPKSKPITFTATLDVTALRIYINNPSNVTNIMLTRGTIPYPYEPYNGDIVREKDIADVYSPQNPPKKVAKTATGTYSGTTQNFTTSIIYYFFNYTLGITITEDMIGGTIKLGSYVIGYITSTTQFLVLVGGNMSNGNVVNIYYTTIE